MIKIRVVSSKSDINNLTRNDQVVHISFRASSTDMFRILQSSPRLRTIQVPPTYYKKMPQTARDFLEIQGVEIIPGDIWGYRKDIDECYTISDEVIDRIKDLLADGLSAEEIANVLYPTAKLSPAMVNHIIKVAVMESQDFLRRPIFPNWSNRRSEK